VFDFCKLLIILLVHFGFSCTLCMYTSFVGRVAKYYDDRVCFSVREHISGTTRPIFANFFVHVTYGNGLVLLWQR